MSYLADHWSFDPFLVTAAVVVALHEAGLANLRRRSVPSHTRTRRLRSLFFYGGVALLLLTVMSPIDYWADDYFFVHMLEHLLIAFYAPILIVAGAPWLPLLHGLPVGFRRRFVRALLLGRFSVALRSAGRLVTNPWTALISFNAVMVVWHVPALFDAAQENQSVHIWLMHASFFVTGVLFWLQIIPSYPFRLKASPFWQIGAIICTNVVMFVLAMTMSLFTESSWYSVYAHVPGVTLVALRRPADRRGHPVGLRGLLGHTGSGRDHPAGHGGQGGVLPRRRPAPPSGPGPVHRGFARHLDLLRPCRRLTCGVA